jgi:hypothetical protein
MERRSGKGAFLGAVRAREQAVGVPEVALWDSSDAEGIRGRNESGFDPYLTRFVTSPPTDNCPQPKEALPAVSTLTLPY